MENVLRWMNDQADLLHIPAASSNDEGDQFPAFGDRVVVNVHPQDMQAFKQALMPRLVPSPGEAFCHPPNPFPRARVNIQCSPRNVEGQPSMRLDND